MEGRTKADRPYGRFPSDVAEDEPSASAPPPLHRRDRILGTGRSRRIRVVAAAVGILLIALGIVGGSQPVRRVAVRPTPAPSPTVQQIYQIVAPSVVSIRATDASGETGRGAGVVVDDTPLVLTAWHVVKGAKRIDVTFADGTQAQAAAVRELPAQDIAVLQPFTAPKDVPAAVLGNADALRPGDPAYAIGDPFGLTRTYTAGIVSGLERTVSFPELPKALDRLIQFDAAVDPGSSGGPLIDGRGEVVGIVTGIPHVEKGGFAGVGFAVRIDVAGGGLGVPPD